MVLSSGGFLAQEGAWLCWHTGTGDRGGREAATLNSQRHVLFGINRDFKKCKSLPAFKTKRMSHKSDIYTFFKNGQGWAHIQRR